MRGEPPAPSTDPEIIAAEKACQEMRDIAKKLPTPVSSKREPSESHYQFGNNFYMLFEALEIVKSNPNSGLVETYLRIMEKKYGEKWTQFIKDNADLMSQISKVIKQKLVYNPILYSMHDLLSNPKTRHLAIALSKEIKLTSIEIDIWNALNPLLKKASEAMISAGFDSKDLR